MALPIRALASFFGPDRAPVSHLEKLVSAVGGFIGILLVILVSLQFLKPHSAGLIIASMGASAVLLFAVPHGQLSQPWALIGGHLLSALVGVTVAKFVPDLALASGLAVGLAIGVMYYLRCIHPPGGATALSAVIGGAEVHALGYQFILSPVALNVVVILVTAVAVNFLFAWRRYPVSLAARPPHKKTSNADSELTHGDLAYALRKMNSYVDVTEEDLAEIYWLAHEHAHQGELEPADILRGRAYSNGRYAHEWSVRQIVDNSGRTDPEDDVVVYKVVAGKGRRGSGTCTRAEFARWARYEVERNENSWQRTADRAGTDDLALSPALLSSE